MAIQDVDVVVIGMGPGGEDVAGRLAEAGLEVVGVEKELVGGECPYWGCVPSKMMIRGADALAEARRVPDLSGTTTVSADFALVAKRVRDEATDDWNDQVAADRFTSKGGRLVRGAGRLTGPREVTVGEDVFRARRGVVLNTGTTPAIPPIDGLAGTPYWTNREALKTRSAPPSLIVLGGGAIGVELALMFRRFGSEVTVIEHSPRLLAQEEPEAGELLATVFDREGITVATGVAATTVRHDGDHFTVTAGGVDHVGRHLLVATGRRPRLADLGLESVGLDSSARSLAVDDRLQATDGLWAIGDITGKGAFTHVSMYQADIAVRAILDQGGPGADYTALPRVTFTDPEIGAVGLTEKQAREQGLNVRVGYTDLPSTSRGWIHKTGNDGFLKVVEDADRGVLVGATSAGPMGGEVLSGLVVAVHGRVPTSTLLGMIYAYPTFHRGIETALRDLH